MKKIVLIGTLLCVAFYIKAGCDDSSNTMTASTNSGIFDLAAAVNQTSTNQGCDRMWGSDFIQCQVKLNGTYNSYLTTLFNTGSVNFALVGEYIHNYGGSVSNSLSATIKVDVDLQGCIWEWCNHIVQRDWVITFLHAGKVTVLPGIYCSGKEYSWSELITFSPVQHTNQVLTFSPAHSFVGGFVTFNQPVNNSVSITYTATIMGQTISRTWTRTIHSLEQADFTSTAQSAGAITNLSPSSLMTNYISISGGVAEFTGPGLILNGTNFYFDPSVANTGNNVLNVRTNNNGCLSEWSDTVFYVTPIVTSINVPVLNLPATFGVGETGLFYVTNTTGSAQISASGKFHFGCSNRNYIFSLNTYQSGVTYEWKVMYQNIVYATGVGNTFTVAMPDRTAVNRNVSSSVHTIEDAIQNSSLLYNTAIAFGSPQLSTFYTGDEMKVMCRGVNVFGATSDWGHVLVGVVPSPELENNSVLCYNQNPVLSPVTNTQLYLDSINYNSVRSVMWDINNDGIFELDGSQDDVLQLLVTNQKSDLMISRIIDSTKFYGYNLLTNEYFDEYSPEAGEVCYSVIDTVRIVRNPIFSTMFNNLDTLSIGTPVRGVVSGAWFSVNLDTIKWNWTDGSMTYYGDTNWHYLNDLGGYSLVVTVVDSFGCMANSNYLNGWYVPGVLSSEELEDISLNIYPVPVQSNLIIDTDQQINSIVILDINGKIIGEFKEKTIDLSGIVPGMYFVNIEFENRLITKKITKL
jgi:hypothetical protein